MAVTEAKENVEEASEAPTRGEKRMPKETFEPPPLARAVTTYVGYLILYVVSLVGDFLRSVGLKKTGHVEVTKKEVGLGLGLVIDKSYLTSGYRRYTRRFVVNYEGVARVIYPNRRVYLR